MRFFLLRVQAFYIRLVECVMCTTTWFHVSNYGNCFWIMRSGSRLIHSLVSFDCYMLKTTKQNQKKKNNNNNNKNNKQTLKNGPKRCIKNELQHAISFFLSKKKWLTVFDKALMLFWKTCLHLKQLFDARLLIWKQPSFSVPKITVLLEVAPTMTDLISLKENRPFPCQFTYFMLYLKIISTIFKVDIILYSEL